jgi:peptide/nickel transport system permease protein
MARPRRGIPLVAATVTLGLVLAGALVGLVWTPYLPSRIDLRLRYAAPSALHWLGTDQFGRDVLSRVMAGAFATLGLGVVSTLLGLALALPLALVAGYRRGPGGRVLLALVDALLSVPSLVTALLVIVALGTGQVNAIVAVGLAMVPRLARVLYAAVAAEVAKDYVTAAIARGERLTAVLVRELLPNIWPTVLVEASLYVGFGIAAGASLSYLGLGSQPPASDWGLLIRDAWTNLGGSAWPLLGPAAMLVMTVICINLAGDALRAQGAGGAHG